MLFNDDEGTFIFIDDKNKIIKFNKKESRYLKIETTEICCELYYTYSSDRDKDYERLVHLFQKETE